MKNLFFIFFLLFCTSLSAQKENINWCFADSNQLSFRDEGIILGYSDVTLFDEPNIRGGNAEPCASISDSKGELQFYVSSKVKTRFPFVNSKDGKEVIVVRASKLLNKNHEILINGDSLNVSSTVTNGALIIPQSKKGQYYLFTIEYMKNRYRKAEFDSAFPLPCAYSYPRIYLHQIDMNANNGRGKVVIKNQMLMDIDVVERLSAVKHRNGKDWWLISHERDSDRFLIWLVDNQGVHFHAAPSIGLANYFVKPCKFDSLTGWAGESSVTPDGKKFANFGGQEQLDMFDFDRCTGKFSNYRYLGMNKGYGLCFSPNGRFLYYSGGASIFQIDLNNPDNATNKTLIYEIDRTIETFAGWEYAVFGQMELAPNGKIYIGNFSSALFDFRVPTHLSAIEQPDSLGKKCQFKLEGVSLGKNRNYHGLPNMPNYNLGAALPIAHAGRGDSVCRGQRVRLGTPPVRSGLVFRWSPAQGLDDSTAAQPYATPDSTTVYRLTVTDTTLSAPCNVAVDDVTVEVLRARASASVYTLDLSKDSTIQFYNDSEGATRAEWDFGNNTRSTDYYPLPVRYQKRGVYRVKLTAYGKNDCSDSAFVTINVVGIPKSRAEASESYFSLYPNPTDDRVYCRFPAEKYPTLTAEIYSLTGVKLKSETLTGVDASFSVQDLAEGIYICKIISLSGAVVKTGKVGVVK